VTSEKYFTSFQEFGIKQVVTLPDGNAVYGIGSGHVKWKSDKLGLRDVAIELKDVRL